VAGVRRPKVGEESPRLGLSRDQVAALLEAGRASGARDFLLVALLFYNGLRISEALALDVAHLGEDGGQRVLSLRRKGNKRARAPINAAVYAAIGDAVGARPAGPLLATRSGRRLDRQAAWKIIGRLARRAGIEHAVSPHSLRHTFVTLALDAGVSLRDVQDAAGHADPRTTRRYDRERHAPSRSPGDVLAAYLATPPHPRR